MIGYTENEYRLIGEKTNKIVAGRNVIFDESRKSVILEIPNQVDEELKDEGESEHEEEPDEVSSLALMTKRSRARSKVPERRFQRRLRKRNHWDVLQEDEGSQIGLINMTCEPTAMCDSSWDQVSRRERDVEDSEAS